MRPDDLFFPSAQSGKGEGLNSIYIKAQFPCLYVEGGLYIYVDQSWSDKNINGLVEKNPTENLFIEPTV